MRWIRSNWPGRPTLTLGALLLCLATFPDPLLAARLELRLQETGSSVGTTLVGETIDVDVWVDSESETLSGAAVFLTYDGDVFELLEQDRDPVTSGFQPFAPGGFLRNGEIFRNTWLDPEDPAAAPAGEQLDYSVVRATDSGAGPAATFRLKAIAPAVGATIQIDESGIRETRVFQPDGSHRAFRFITPLTVDVRGITIQNVPEELVLARGQVDSTTFQLDNLLFDPLYGPSSITWHVDATNAVDVRIDTETRRLIIAAPDDRSLWEQLTLRAVNPDGQTTSSQLDLFVNAGPVLSAVPDTLHLVEDGSHRLDLDALVHDEDTPDAQLTWGLSSPPTLGARLTGPPYELVLEPQADWNGQATVRLLTQDRFGFADSTEVVVDVQAVNDAPVSLFSPNLRITRGKTDSTLSLDALFADVDDDLSTLPLSWAGASRVTVERRGNRLIVGAPEDWEGSETVQLRLTDGADATVSVPLTVTVVSSLAPAVTNAPSRFGLVPGQASVLDLTQYVTDPDDPTTDLLWSVQGHSQLLIQVSTSGAVRIEPPDGFSGTETVRFSAVDPTGESATFDVLMFAAPAGGEPLVAPLPDLTLPSSGANATLDLDDYVFDLDHSPQQMEWTAVGPEGLELRVDRQSHVLTVLAADSLQGEFTVELTAIDPQGQQATVGLRVIVTATPIVIDPDNPADPVDPVIEPPDPVVLSLDPLPTIRVTEGGFDRSIMLDDFVTDGDPTAVRWEAIATDHVQVVIDPDTRQVTVLADNDWTGPVLVTVRALDLSGTIIAETFMGVQVEAAAVALALRELVEIPVLQGDSLFSVDVSQVLETGLAADLTWTVSGSGTFDVALQSGHLEIQTDIFGTAGSQVLTLIARDAAGNVATGTLLVNVLPIDGSAGDERDDFRVAVVPNPVVSQHLDVFVIDDEKPMTAPLFRSHEGEWSDLNLTSVTDGIWQTTHTLQPGASGTLTFLALRLDGDRLSRAQQLIHVGSAVGGAGKIAAAGMSLEWQDGGDAVVAVIPEEAEATSGLIRSGPAVRLHATQQLSGRGRLSLAAADPRSWIYHWDEAAGRWQHVDGLRDRNTVAVTVELYNRYAVFTDATGPDVSVEAAGVSLSDDGSGLASVQVLADGVLIPDALLPTGDGTYRWTDAAPSSDVTVRVSDRAGNVTTIVTRPQERLPRQFAVGQNFPNPFNPETTIPLTVGLAGGRVRVDIFNSAGQRVRQLLDSSLPAGAHDILWDGRDDSGRGVASGTYLYRAIVDGTAATRRMTLLR